MDLGLTDRAYIVTGGTKGLGFATAKALVDDGARVLVSSRSEGSVENALEALGPRADGAAADLADPAAAAELVERAQGAFGRIDGALVSVGGPKGGAFSSIADADWQAAFDTVFLGTVRLIRTLVPRLEAGAAIGLVLSSSVRSPIAGLTLSNGLRPGLAMLVKQLADELGPRGIRIVGLLPGRIATDRVLDLDRGDPDARQRSEAAIPLRRLGDAAEFGRVAAFLLSPAASYVTGSMIAVDGGMIRSL
ncbi:MAG TPA: SDR family oxidoreductase [Gryllotalpicola sp.]